MEKCGLRNNYILAFVYFVLFLFLLCFDVEFSRTLLKTLRGGQNFRLSLLFFGLLSPVVFYIFICDLNSVYERIQHFFFRNTFFATLVPSLLIVSILGYAIIPKIFNFQISDRLFIFVGPMFFTMHLVFIARMSRQTSFPGFINYLFIFSLLYLITLLFLEMYFAIAGRINFFELVFDSTRRSLLLIKSVILHLLP